MDIIQIIGVGLIGTILTIILKDYRQEYALITALITGAFVLIIITGQIEPVINIMDSMIYTAGMSGGYSQILFKTIGICFITEVAVDTCKDFGNTAIGKKLELAGKVAILIVAIPLFTSLLELAQSLIYL